MEVCACGLVLKRALCRFKTKPYNQSCSIWFVKCHV